eukprot:scaffold35472_cov31-Tisochrysis_lutea.AAC.5
MSSALNEVATFYPNLQHFHLYPTPAISTHTPCGIAWATLRHRRRSHTFVTPRLPLGSAVPCARVLASETRLAAAQLNILPPLSAISRWPRACAAN